MPNLSLILKGWVISTFRKSDPSKLSQIGNPSKNWESPIITFKSLDHEGLKKMFFFLQKDPLSKISLLVIKISGALLLEEARDLKWIYLDCELFGAQTVFLLCFCFVPTITGLWSIYGQPRLIVTNNKSRMRTSYTLNWRCWIFIKDLFSELCRS